MTKTDEWPAGIERRRPRISQNPGLALLLGAGTGALLGSLFVDRDRLANAVIGAAAGGAVGAVGAAAMTQPMSLDQALRSALHQLDASFVSLRYYGRHEARLVFETDNGFQVAIARADTTRTWNADDLDDWLYVALIKDVMKKMAVQP